jgi:EAL domain-containing protein (putative c-di-GMP-specific phosphodiesterase class I)/GGDEF domain-containing protein
MDQRLVNLAYYDSLTDLPNLEYFVEVYNEEVNFVKHNKVVFVIKFISIATINMVHGYKSGSELLKRIAKRLEVLNYDGALDIFKSSRDEFIVYGENLASKDEVLAYVNRINNLLSKPFILNNTKIFMKYKIAIIHKEKNYLDKSLLLKESNITLNSIDVNDELNYAFYDENMEIKLHRMENIKNELRGIIETDNRYNNIYMNYQPLIDLKLNKVVAFEALARFKSDDYGNVSPFEFINIAENNQLIIPLSHIILRESSEFISILRENSHQDIKVAINISGAHLLSEGFVNEIMEIANLSNIDLTMVELEITESLLMNNFSLINERLEQLQGKGISISLDDFGTGYSSFARLAELNIDCLKIDKSFIDKILVWEEDEIIAGEIIAMAHRFGMKVIAEGVEEIEQIEYLKKYNCDIIQGYFYSKPLSQEDALDYIEKKSE